MSPPARAIFLSYAREDAAAARRVAEALRAHGLEVWFDENELRGGDAWDAKIKAQIRECALFMPVVSGRTQERHEGYFRREWKLAIERTADMAAGVAFIVPVVVDDTRESDAIVPEEFMRVQWSRLPGALPTPQFVAQVQRLLEAPRAGPRPATAVPRPDAVVAPAKKSVSPAMVFGSLAVIAASVATVVIVTRERAAPAPVAAATPATAARPPVALDKSIAVLPFANLSDQTDNAFFADGVHEDILTHLALVRDLKVISRTTVLQYRDTKKAMRQIGDELGVAYILEGSVRRAGSRVRVTGQLINARTDEHVWARNYDRDLTDIFAIQAALAQEIAGALSAAISPETQRHIDQKPTNNPEAYDLFLQARAIRNRAPTSSTAAITQAEQLFGRAVQLDPGFAAAWGELAVVHALNVFWERDASARRMAQGDAAIAQAQRLAPEAPDVVRLVGTYAYYARRDYATATAQFEKIIRQQPNDPTGYASLGLIQRRQGRWTEALANQQRAVELDPANITNLRNLLSTVRAGRRWADALAVQRRLLALQPGQLTEELAAAETEADARNDYAPIDTLLARLSPADREAPVTLHHRKRWAMERGDYAEFKRLDARQPEFPELEAPGTSAAVAGLMYWAHGDVAAARQRIASHIAATQAQLKNEPANLRAQLHLGVLLAIDGQTDEGLRLVQAVAKAMPATRDALDGSVTLAWVTFVEAIRGDRDSVVANVQRYMSQPGQIPAHRIAGFPAYHFLRDDPKFQALIKDPKNNAPLF